MRDIFVDIINQSGLELPKYQTSSCAGMDLRAAIESEVVISPLQRVLIKTGLYIALPDGCEAQIRPRSGLAFNHGITVLNSPGTIDADYRGEIKILLINLGDQPHVINRGDRIAQMVVNRVERIDFRVVETLTTTERGEGGYGHTGKT